MYCDEKMCSINHTNKRVCIPKITILDTSHRTRANEILRQRNFLLEKKKNRKPEKAHLVITT